MKYCEKTTNTHPLAHKYPKHVMPICDIFVKEGAKPNKLFEDEIAINLDKIEIAQKRKEPKPTVDMAVGLSDNGKAPNILLVELKFRVKSVSNIEDELSSLLNKVNHSIALLTREVPIHKKTLIIFNDIIAEQAKNRAKRFSTNSPVIKVMTAEKFKEEYF